jgi:pimeloyl-ACP methyl ester carboxylesterase
MKKIILYFIIGVLFFSACNNNGSNTMTVKDSISSPAKDSTTFTPGYMTVNGIKMYYEIHGKGDTPLVLIHGGGSTIGTSFGNILRFFARPYKVIAVELQAHGHTGDRDAPESFVQDADDVAALLQGLRIDKANILGFSNGGSTALQVAIRHPQMVNKLVAIAAATKRNGFIPGFFETMPNATLENMPQPLKTAFLAINPDSSQLFNMFTKDKNRMVGFKDWPDELLRVIHAPTLIMNADKDVILTEHALAMSKLIPNAKLVILPGVHGAFLGEICTVEPGSKMPEVTAALVREFLDGK